MSNVVRTETDKRENEREGERNATTMYCMCTTDTSGEVFVHRVFHVPCSLFVPLVFVLLSGFTVVIYIYLFCYFSGIGGGWGGLLCFLLSLLYLQ
jgi:hypothetical protein